MTDEEWTEFSLQFQYDRELEDAQDYMATLDEMNEEFE